MIMERPEPQFGNFARGRFVIAKRRHPRPPSTFALLVGGKLSVSSPFKPIYMISTYRSSTILTVSFKCRLFSSLNLKAQTPSQITSHAFCSDSLKDAAKRGLLSQAKQLHSHVTKLGFYGALSMQNQILHAYAKCGEISHAHQVFDEMHVKNVVSWNTVICGAVTRGRGSTWFAHRCFDYFRLMQMEGVKPDGLTMNGLIRASMELDLLALGKQLHGFAVKFGFDLIAFVGCALVNLYGAYGFVEEAWSVFDNINCRDLVLWNAMVCCYGSNSLTKEATRVFRLMQIEGFTGDEFTFTSLLSSCAGTNCCGLGRQFHGLVIKLSFNSDVRVASTAVDMYAKNEAVIEARKVFDEITVPNVISWNTMIVGYGQQGDGEEAMKLLVRMLGKNLDPDELTIASIVSSSANLSVINEVTQIHCYAVKFGFETHLSIANALIVAYSKCGSLESSLKSFESVLEPDVITWTSLIGAYGFHGCADESIAAFQRMLSSGIRPDSLAFLGVISSCSHSGLTSKGLYYFRMMISEYHIEPKSSHYACLVDLLGRAGLIDEAFDILTLLPVGVEPNILGALFGACKIHGHVKLAEWAAKKLFELEPKSPINYRLLSNIYASEGNWLNVAVTRKMLRERCDHKHPGCSWIDVGGMSHTFVSSDRSQPLSEEVYAMLGVLKRVMKEEYELKNWFLM